MPKNPRPTQADQDLVASPKVPDFLYTREVDRWAQDHKMLWLVDVMSSHHACTPEVRDRQREVKWWLAQDGKRWSLTAWSTGGARLVKQTLLFCDYDPAQLPLAFLAERDGKRWILRTASLAAP